MMAVNSVSERQGERGNVLFLILIAVALFAALSYAVTQSTRSGSGDASGETNLINSAQLAQYPAGVRTAVVRMIIAGVSVEQLAFNAPDDFTNVSDLTYDVFHPTGGGAVFQEAPQDVLSAQSGVSPSDKGRWIFTSAYQVDGVGSTDASSGASNDLMAILPGVGQNVCKKLNDELGVTATGNPADKIPNNPGTPAVAVPTLAETMTEGTGVPSTATSVIGGDLLGQPFGCFRIGADSAPPPGKTYVYYHVLVER